MGLGGGQGRCKEEVKFFFGENSKYFLWGGGSGQGVLGVGGGGGSGGCERRIEVFEKIQKKIGGGGGQVGGRVGGVVQGGCERNVGNRGIWGLGDVNQE